MRSAWFALLVAVALGAVSVAAKADAVDSSAGSPAAEAVVQPAAQADTTRSGKGDKKQIAVSVEYSVFRPSRGEARSDFGSAWHSIGLGLFRPERPNTWVFDWDVTLLTKDGPSDALLLPLTIGVQRGWGTDPDQQPYLAVRVGPYYGRVDDNAEGPDDSTVGANANVSVGMVFSRRYVVEARYDWFSKIAGNDLNGFTLTAGVKAFDFSL